MNLFWQFICMIAFGAACWAAGDILLKNFLGKRIVLPALARHTLAFTTGNVAFSYVITALGFTGYFIPSVLWTVFIAGSGLAIWRIAMRFMRPLQGPSLNHAIQEEGGGKGILFFLVGTVALFLLPAILQAAAPPYVRDSLVYHLLCPKEYLKVGHLVHIEGNLFSAFPKGHEMFMTLLLAISGDRAAQGFSILQQVAAIGGLYSLTRLMAGPWPSVVCTLGYATVPPVMYFTGCGYVEPALLMALGNCLLALTFLFQSHMDKSINGGMRLGAITFIGFLAGWMTALKYSGLIYLGLIGLIILWGQRKASIRKFMSIGSVFTLGALPGLSWMVWNWITLGNPVYPMAWFLLGGKGWEEAQALAMSLYFDAYGMGRNLSDYLLLSWRLAFSGRFDSIRFDGAIGPFLLLFLALAAASGYLLIRRRLAGIMTKRIGFMFIVSTAFFVFGTQQTRFWVPSQMLACAFAAPAVELLVNWARNRRLIKKVLFLILVGSLAWNMWFLGKQFITVGYYKPVLGMEQEKDFLIRKVPGYPVLEFINQDLPKSSRLMCVWTGAYGYYIDRQYYSDTLIEDITIKKLINVSANGKELSQRLVQAGYTHIFMRVSLLVKNMRPEQQAIFVDFLRKGAVELFSYQDYSIFEIHGE
jgi:hypothetical protein